MNDWRSATIGLLNLWKENTCQQHKGNTWKRAARQIVWLHLFIYYAE